MTINGTGNQTILYKNFKTLDNILINNISNSYKDNYIYNLTNQINNITLIWNNPIIDCSFLFYNLSNIIKIDLSYFNTSLVTNMRSMFNGCSSLISLNLNNFNTSLVTNMSFMFYGCSSLKSLNLNNFNTSLVTNMRRMFNRCSSLISLNLNNFDTSLVTDMNYIFYECNSILIYCINEKNKNSISSLLSNSTNDCNSSCFANLEYKLIKEKRKCIVDCYNDDKYIYEYNNICYNLCPEGTSISSNNKYLCVKECPDDKPYEDLFNNECIQDCNSIELFNNECKIKSNNIKTEDETIKNIKNDILNGTLDELIFKLLSNEKEYLIIESKDIKYEITTTDNQNNNNGYLNLSIIRLGECENELKKYYNIDEKESLIIFKIDKYEEGLLIPIVEYEVYDFKNKKQLDLNICNNIKIEILYPAIIDEDNEFKHNLSSEYYNDICYIYNTENDTDITLADRKREFNDNNMSLCEVNCEYDGYDSDIKKSKCKCEIKINLRLISDIKNNIELNTLFYK